MVSSLGRVVVNNLAVPVIPDRQVVLKVRFAEVQKAAIDQFGANILSTGALNTPGATSTQQFGPPRAAEVTGRIGAHPTGFSSTFTLNDLLNVFAFRPDLVFLQPLLAVAALQGTSLYLPSCL
jgi:Flp pilus assembly secretin CpaC